MMVEPGRAEGSAATVDCLGRAVGADRATAAGSAAAAILLGLFSVAIGINLARGRSHIDCGCFQSALRQQLSISLLVRNGFLIALALPLRYQEDFL